MKVILTIFSILLLGYNLNAQTNYIKNGDMSGVKLNYIGSELTGIVSTPPIGSGWAGFYGSLKSLNITSIQGEGEHGDVIKLAATGILTNMSDNPRLVQRIKCPAGIYRLKFWAKAVNGKNVRVAASVRPSGNNIPAYPLKDYVNDGSSTENPAHKLFSIDESWKEYTIDFDLTQTVNSFKPAAGTPFTLEKVNGNQFPVICLNLWQTGKLDGSEVLIDNVSFVKL